jgi:Uma2 family endonuclease
MQSGVRTLKLTYEDYLHLPEDGKRHELIDGDHCVTPSPTPRHQLVLANLVGMLHAYLREHPLGRIYPAPLDVVLSDTDVVQPDLLFLAGGRQDLVTEKNLRGAPDFVVEVLSDSTRRTDEITKRHLYERHGVREYWIIDPVLETVKVYRLTEDGFRREAELSTEAGDRLTTPLLPGLSVALDEIFR